MKIPVVYKSGEEDLIEPKFLDILLHIGEIQEFRRSDHWVNATDDPIRSPQKRQNNFQGDDRRRQATAEINFSL